MSKEAALRAMREARYAERSAGSTAKPARPTTPKVRAATRPADQVVGPASSTDGLCGHRSMNGRACTREHGHEAKSHRYS